MGNPSSRSGADDLRAEIATLEALAHEDPLTGLLNRRGFLRELSRAIAYRARYDAPIALLLADLDRFKPVNDTHGHAVGDLALKHLADILRRNVRASDGVARLGGDEFVVTLWQLDEASARHKAATLEEIVAATPLVANKVTLTLEASLGPVGLEKDDTPEQALARADRAMYRRKRQRQAYRGSAPFRR